MHVTSSQSPHSGAAAPIPCPGSHQNSWDGLASSRQWEELVMVGARWQGLRTQTAQFLGSTGPTPSPWSAALPASYPEALFLPKHNRGPWSKVIFSPHWCAVDSSRRALFTSQLCLFSLQLFMITERLRDLEDQSATWRQREVLLFTMLLSSCITNLWLWMRQ